MFAKECSVQLPDYRLHKLPTKSDVISQVTEGHPHDIVVCSLRDSSGGIGHAVTITSGYIFDSNERTAIELTTENLSKCVSDKDNLFEYNWIDFGYRLETPGQHLISLGEALIWALQFRNQYGLAKELKVCWNNLEPTKIYKPNKRNVVNLYNLCDHKFQFAFRPGLYTLRAAPFVNAHDVPLHTLLNCQYHDIVMMDIVREDGRILDAVVCIGKTMFSRSGKHCLPFNSTSLSTYVQHERLDSAFYGVTNIAIITTPKTNRKVIKYLATIDDTW